MEPIFYKVKATNECFKLVLVDDAPKEEINDLLDAILEGHIKCEDNKCMERITKEEFEQSHDKWMEIDVMDSTNKFKIATLTTQKID